MPFVTSLSASFAPTRAFLSWSLTVFRRALALLPSILVVLGIFSAASTRAAAPTYLLSEGFEGPGYENSGWVVPPNSTSAPEPDHTGTVLLGTQSLRCNGVSFIQRSFVREDPIYCYLRVRWASWSDYKFVVDWLDDAQGSTATLLTSFGRKLEIKHGSVSVPGTTTINLDTTYHVWLEWTKGSGSDGTMKLFVSTDETKPAAPEVFITTGNGVGTALFDIGPFGAGVDVVYDSILIDDEPIGSNPGGNAPPTISGVANQSTLENTPTAPLAFTIGDLETNAVDLAVTGVSSNQDVIPDANIVFGGSESNRTVTLTPAPNQSGVATITLTVSDGTASASNVLRSLSARSTAPPSFPRLPISPLCRIARPRRFRSPSMTLKQIRTVSGSMEAPQTPPSFRTVTSSSVAQAPIAPSRLLPPPAKPEPPSSPFASMMVS